MHYSVITPKKRIDFMNVNIHKKRKKKKQKTKKLTKQIEHVKLISTCTDSNRQQDRVGLSSSNVREQSPNSSTGALLLTLFFPKFM
jgi:hypothetical protein